jgi:DNA repair exonuclease SbcCD ATPase subunit
LEIPAKRLAQLEKEHKQRLQREQAEATLVEELLKSNLELKQQHKILETQTQVLKDDHQDINTQLRRTINRLHSLKEEGVSLRTLVSTLESTMTTLPAKIVSQTREKYQDLYVENAELIEKNATLEERVQRAEMDLITIKLQYAESENEKEEMHKRLYELKKLMSI